MASEPLLNRVRQTLTQECGVSPRARLVIAVSGGADSMALLRLLDALQAPLRLELFACHFDHALHDSSEEHCAFVRSQVADLGLPFVSQRWSQPQHSEHAAREARYEFLLHAAREFATDAFVLGHHRDDQIETSLLRVSRGAGLRGIIGMSYRRDHDGTPVLRPLLNASKQELLDYLLTIKQEWREDPSNQSTLWTRNRLRLEVLPQLDATLGPAWRQNWAENLKQLRLSWEEISARADEILAAGLLQTDADTKFALDWSKLKHHGSESLRVALLLWFTRAGVPNIRREHILTASVIIQNGHSGQSVSLPAGWSLHFEQGQHDQGRLYLESPNSALQLHYSLESQDLPIADPAQARIPHPMPDHLPRSAHAWVHLDSSSQLNELDEPDESDETNQTAQPKEPRRLILRHIQPGDRVQLLGAPGHRKVARVFQDHRVPRRLRPFWPIVSDQTGIVWIPGIGVSERCRVPIACRKATQLKLLPDPKPAPTTTP